MYLNLGNNICCIIIFSRYNAENSLKINLKIVEFDIKEDLVYLRNHENWDFPYAYMLLSPYDMFPLPFAFNI